MTRRKIVMALSFVLFLMVGCSLPGKSENMNQESEFPDSLYSVSAEKVYLIQDTSTFQVSVDIPLVEGENSERINQTLIMLVEDKVNEMLDHQGMLTTTDKDIHIEYRELPDMYSVDLVGEISFADDEMLSVVFSGLMNTKSAAHPTNVLFSININLKKLTKVRFSELYLINNDLYLTFSKLAEDAIIELAGGRWPLGWGDFGSELCSEEDFIIGMELENEYYWYFVDDGIYISYPVPYALGNHLEVLIPHELIQCKKGDSLHEP